MVLEEESQDKYRDGLAELRYPQGTSKEDYLRS